MTRPALTTCEHCGLLFPVPNPKGPIPKFCRASHRQRAWEAKTFTKRDKKAEAR